MGNISVSQQQFESTDAHDGMRKCGKDMAQTRTRSRMTRFRMCTHLRTPAQTCRPIRHKAIISCHVVLNGPRERKTRSGFATGALVCVTDLAHIVVNLW